MSGRPGMEGSEVGMVPGPRREGRAGPRWGAAELGREALAYADTLHRLARYLTGNATDAEDLVQETYARALRAAGQFTPGTNLKAWLFRILRNTFFSAYRQQRHDPVVGGLDTVNPVNEVATDAWFQNDIDLERLRGVVGEEIEAAVMSLSEEARTVILLDLEGLTDGEVADIVGCAVGTVKSRLARARAALREQLRDYGKAGTSGRASPPTPPPRRLSVPGGHTAACASRDAVAMTIDKGAPGDFRTDTDVASGRRIGRVEHVAAGRVAHVHTSEELLAFPSRGWREPTAPSCRRRSRRAVSRCNP